MPPMTGGNAANGAAKQIGEYLPKGKLTIRGIQQRNNTDGRYNGYGSGETRLLRNFAVSSQYGDQYHTATGTEQAVYQSCGTAGQR